MSTPSWVYTKRDGSQMSYKELADRCYKVHTGRNAAIAAARRKESELVNMRVLLALAQNRRPQAENISDDGSNGYILLERLRAVEAITKEYASANNRLASLGQISPREGGDDEDAHGDLVNDALSIKPLECGICMEPIPEGCSFVGKNCAHFFCLPCVERQLSFKTIMSCPYRCGGNSKPFATPDFLSTIKQLHEKLKDSAPSYSTETIESDFARLLENGCFILAHANKDGESVEYVIDGPKSKKVDVDGSKLPTIYVYKNKLKTIGFKFNYLTKEGEGDLPAKVWYRKAH